MPFAFRHAIAISLVAALANSETVSAATINLVGTDSVELIGQIMLGDGERLAAAIQERRHSGDSTPNVFLNSPGGNLSAGIAAADAISMAAANTIVGENETCASACFLLFLAGKQKATFPGARVGVHSASAWGNETDFSLATSARLARVYEALGAPPAVIAKSVTTVPGEIYWLTEDDLRAMNVVFMSASPRQPTVAALPPTSPQRQRFSVEGLAVGAPVVPWSAAYKAYSCKPSVQYPQSIWCHRVKIEGDVHVSLTILHSPDRTTAYVNKEVSPAFFQGADIDIEIARLSDRYGSSPRIYASPERSGFPRAVIAIWGMIELRPLTNTELALLAQGKNPHRGVLVDFLGDFKQSAQARLPVYALSGRKGFVWIASFDESGWGKLRFFAANPSQMTAPTPVGFDR